MGMLLVNDLPDLTLRDSTSFYRLPLFHWRLINPSRIPLIEPNDFIGLRIIGRVTRFGISFAVPKNKAIGNRRRDRHVRALGSQSLCGLGLL
jgi:hypothetical protein